MTLATALNRRLSVKLIRKPSEAKLLSEPMRREMLRLLCRTPMTETQLSKMLGLRAPTVGHHLSALKSSGFVSVSRQEVGIHGMLEKYYESSAQLYFIDGKNMPLEIVRYYMPVVIERARGVLACARMNGKSFDLSSDYMERFALAFANSISKVAEKYDTPVSEVDPEACINRLYSEALQEVLKTSFKELRDVLSPVSSALM
jgi:DNA-binding transcriptional ArsR family regulator